MGRTGDAFEKLEALMDRLREPGGCPWDREQTSQSLRTYLLEETYEVLEALEGPDWDELSGELGDLLFQIVFHARIAKEDGKFALADVALRIHDKMVNRHPHVFGDADAKTAADVLAKWERNKRIEKKESGAGPLDGIPKALPALARALRSTEKAAQLGFDWRRTEDVVRKLDEEIAEWKEALAETGDGAKAKAAEELGDILFTIANVARKLGIDPEDALQKTNEKFRRRFDQVTERLEAAGRPIEEASLEEMDAAWDAVKRDERL